MSVVLRSSQVVKWHIRISTNSFNNVKRTDDAFEWRDAQFSEAMVKEGISTTCKFSDDLKICITTSDEFQVGIR